MRHPVFGHMDIRCRKGLANELYALMNVVVRLDLARSYMVEALESRADLALAYVADMLDEDAETAVRYLSTLLPAGGRT